MRMHTGETPFQCMKCLKKFTRAQNHKMHIAKLCYPPGYKKPAKIWKCPYCPYTAKCKEPRHLLQHTGETPFKCEECGKGFTRKPNYIRHKRQQHGIRDIGIILGP